MRAIITFFFALLLTLFSGCGSNDPTGNNNNPPATHDSLIASFDSLSASNFVAPYYSSFGFSDTLSIKNFRVSFKVISNLDTTSGSYLNFYALHDSDTTNYYSISKNKNELNNLIIDNTFSLNTNIPHYFYSSLIFGFELFPLTPERTIKVRDFRIYAILD